MTSSSPALPTSANHWQRTVIESVVTHAKADSRIAGVSLSGSGATDALDEYSDLDFVIAISPEHIDAMMDERKLFAEKVATLLTSFTGEHVGEPRLLICLYALPELLHVDYKFVALPDVVQRVDTPAVLWERKAGLLSQYYEDEAHYPAPSLQWCEDRFWVWLHYGATKLARGEHLECHTLIGFIGENVIGPLAKINAGFEANGLRRLESQAPEVAATLASCLRFTDAESLGDGLHNIVRLYLELRSCHPENSTLVNHPQAQKHALHFTEAAINAAIDREKNSRNVVK